MQQAAKSVSTTASPDWGFTLRLTFRLVFAYEVIYSFPFPLSLLPWSDNLFGWYTAALNSMTTWAGAYILHLGKPLEYSILGGGDSMFGWVHNLVQILIAIAAAALWTFLDRKRPNYNALQEWLWLYVRVVLGAAMITYGAIKVIKVQFPDLFLWRILSPYGDSNPTGLLWSFMGFSKTYNIFTGLIEMMGGVLLFVPKVATLGALLSLGAMANVFLLNVSYDVPVKLYSFNLLLMSVYLLVPESRRMLNVFVLNRAAEPVAHPPLFQKKALNTSMMALQIVLLIAICGTELYQSHKRYFESGDGAPPPLLYGVYNVSDFVVDGEDHPALFSDDRRWRRVTFERYNLAAIFCGDTPVQRYKTEIASSTHALELKKIAGGSWKAEFRFEQPSPAVLTLQGEMDGKKIQATLRRVELKSMPLYANGIHWITDAANY